MSIIVSKYFDDNYTIMNTTADYNFIDYFKNNKLDNIILLSDTEYLSIVNNHNLKDYVKEKYNMDLKNILIHEGKGFFTDKNLEKLDGVNFFLYAVDIHYQIFSENPNNFFIETTKKNKFNLILPYAYFWNYNNNFVPSRNIFFPHNILYHCKIKENPINKVLISGRGYKNIDRYPNRNKIFGLFLNKKNREYLEHYKSNSSYRIEKRDDYSGKVIREYFIDLLSQYLVCFCDEANSIADPYILAKFFEIMSSGSLLITYNPVTKKYFEKLGFKDRIHYYSMTEDFMKDIKYVLDPVNREEVDRIRKAGYEHVWKYHSSEARVKELINMFNNGFDNYETYTDGINGTTYMCNKDYLNDL